MARFRELLTGPPSPLCFSMQIPLVRIHLFKKELSERAGYETEIDAFTFASKNIGNANAMRTRHLCARVCVRI